MRKARQTDMKMNLPNKLSVLRLIMVPIFMAVMLVPCFVDVGRTANTVLQLIGAFLFIAASFTDMLDGKIARKYNLVTDFGKFLDPLADKFMVIGAMVCIFYYNAVVANKNLATLYFAALVIVVFRELAVTSIRLIASSKQNVVIAANMLGKIKTVTQIIAVVAAIVEPVIYSNLGLCGWVCKFPPLTFFMTGVMIIFTIISGINYITGAWKYLNPEK